MLTVLYLMGQGVFEVYQLFHLAGDPNELFENYMKMVVQFSTRMIAVVGQIDSFNYGVNKTKLVDQILLPNKKFKGKANGTFAMGHTLAIFYIVLIEGAMMEWREERETTKEIAVHTEGLL